MDTDVSDTEETSAGETGGREAGGLRFDIPAPMTDAALAEIKAHNGEYGLGDATDVIDELLAEVERLRTWAGLMSLLDRHYPADVFDGTSGDPGPRIVALTREVDRLRDLNAELSETLDVRHDEMQQAKASAETAERELGEMRERIGDWEPGRWYQVRQPNGDLWMETSDRDEAVTAARETGWALYRLWECHGSEWREATDG